MGRLRGLNSQDAVPLTPDVRLLILGLVATFALHFTWEMLQAPAFMGFAGSTWEGTLRCLVASGGDVLLASGAYLVTALTVRRLAWPVRPGWILPSAMWIALGVLATFAFERWALARGRWVYEPEMPLVFGIGLLPLLQWIVVPLVTLAVVRWRRRDSVARQGTST
jgi:hypothetical protein